MRTNKNTGAKFHKYRYKMVSFKFLTVRYFLSIFSFLYISNSYAQLTTNILEKHCPINMVEDSSAHITSFTTKIISGTNYFKWTVSNLKRDGAFMLYYSCDGIHYSYIGNKVAIGVPVNIEIAYYFYCKVPITKDNYYKIVYISNHQSEYMVYDDEYVCDEKLIAQSQ